MFNLGFGEILIICAVLIIVVGPERLPALMKNVGKTLRTVRQASREIQATVGLDELMREDITRPLPPPKPRLPPAATVARTDTQTSLTSEGSPAAVVPPSADPTPTSTPTLETAPESAATAATAATFESGAEPIEARAATPSVGAHEAPAADAAPPPRAPFTPSGEEYVAKAPPPATPSIAEADGLSISERMLLLHTPKEPPASSAADQAPSAANQAPSAANQAPTASSPDAEGASVRHPGGGKEEA